MLSLSALCGGEERKAVDKREKAAATISAALAIDAHACAGCERTLPTGAYSKTQLSKGASKRCKDCTAGGASTAAPPHEPLPLPVVAPSRAALPLPVCSKCRHKGLGHADAGGRFCCEWCWAKLEKRRWPTLGGNSPQFKALTAGMRPSSFNDDDRGNKLALMDVGKEAGEECAELERTGALNGRVVLGFDTESKPCFRAGEQHPICLIQLSTRSRAVLFRVKPEVPLPAALVRLLEDPEVTFVGQDIHSELTQELAQTYGLAIPPDSVLELSGAARASGCLSASVAGYAAALLGVRLTIKSKSLSCSNWSAAELSHPQINYAATDAWVCWAALEVLESADLLRDCHDARPDFFYRGEAGEAAEPAEGEGVRRQRGRQPSTAAPYSPHGAVLKRPKSIDSNLERLSL